MASRGWAGINEFTAAWLLQLRWPLVDVRSSNTMQHSTSARQASWTTQHRDTQSG
ncbi:hypothetical protein CTRI78_v011053 [Colletotrichum trifolii]|uniref:Uncharacterized protein n=1 Tax=Colletotrichum trifolii TaxID=5466 RepID=A0A4R8QKM1_COLTR|nr:hypothetical protein CTRI78_v011053 [Colletotrichum trifolii]